MTDGKLATLSVFTERVKRFKEAYFYFSHDLSGL